MCKKAPGMEFFSKGNPPVRKTGGFSLWQQRRQGNARVCNIANSGIPRVAAKPILPFRAKGGAIRLERSGGNAWAAVLRSKSSRAAIVRRAGSLLRTPARPGKGAHAPQRPVAHGRPFRAAAMRHDKTPCPALPGMAFSLMQTKSASSFLRAPRTERGKNHLTCSAPSKLPWRFQCGAWCAAAARRLFA